MSARVRPSLILAWWFWVVVSVVPRAGAQQNVEIGDKTVALPDQDHRYALLIGLGHYDNNAFQNVSGDNDARVFSEALETYLGFYNDEVSRTGHVFLLTSDDTLNLPSRNNILGTLDNLAKDIDRPEDSLLVIFFSGHGVAIHGKPYLLAYDSVNSKTPEVMAETAVSVDSIVRVLEKYKIGRVLLIIDACRAEWDPENKEGSEPRLSLGGYASGLNAQHALAENLMVLDSASPNESSYVDKNPSLEILGDKVSRPMGFFTETLIQGLGGGAMENGVVTLSHLERYLSDELPGKVQKLKPSYQQHPNFVPLVGPSNDIVLSTFYPEVIDFGDFPQFIVALQQKKVCPPLDPYSCPVSPGYLDDDTQSYLKQWKIQVSDATPGTHVVISPIWISAGPIASHTPRYVLSQNGGRGPNSFTMRFNPPLRSFAFSQVFPAEEGSEGAATARWAAHAYDASGRELGAVKQEPVAAAGQAPAREFKLNAPEGGAIAYIRFDSGERQKNEASIEFSSVFLTDFKLIAKP